MIRPMMIACSAAAMIMGCDGADIQPTWGLQDVTAEVGIAFTTEAGGEFSEEILEVNGSGGCLLDCDGDGDLDLLLANGATLKDPDGGSGPRLYRNEIIPTGRLAFEDVTAESGIMLARWTTGAAAADIDGDGDTDVFLTCFGPDALLVNDGTGKFQITTIEEESPRRIWSTTAVPGDLDGDGDLDFYVVRYVQFDPALPPPGGAYKGTEVMGGPHGLAAERDVLLRNDGSGVFAVESVDATASFGLNAVILDVDGDGLVEVIVGNDSMDNQVLTLGGDGSWKDQGARLGLATNGDGQPQATMGMAVGDINGDGYADLVTTNFSSDSNTVLIGGEGGIWTDATTRYGMWMSSRPLLGWGCVLFDLEGDGDEDLLVVNGHVYPEATQETMDSTWRQRPLLMVWNGQRFQRLPSRPGHWLDEPRLDRTLLMGDLDLDGDPDFVITGANETVRVVRNDRSSGRRSRMAITLLDDREHGMNSAGLGAIIDVAASDRTTRHWIGSGGAFQGGHAPEAYTSAPAGDRYIDITVTWPGGEITRSRHEVSPRIIVTRSDALEE